MENKEIIKKLESLLGCMIGSHTSNETPEKQIELLITELKAKNNESLQLVSGLLPTIEDSGVIGLTIAKNVRPKLSENETSFFIAGFMEAIKYIKTNNR